MKIVGGAGFRVGWVGVGGGPKNPNRATSMFFQETILFTLCLLFELFVRARASKMVRFSQTVSGRRFVRHLLPTWCTGGGRMLQTETKPHRVWPPLRTPPTTHMVYRRGSEIVSFIIQEIG